MTQLRFDERGTKESLRARNDVVVLQAVAVGAGKYARTDVARETGLPGATVSEIVTSLIGRGLVREAGRDATHRGKPRVLLELDDSHHRMVGVHIGPGRVQASVMTLTGHVEESVTVDVHPALDEVLPVMADLMERLAPPDANVTAVGVAAPGIVGDDGVIREAVNYGWRMVPVGKELSRRCRGLPVHVINDANAVALSEVALSASPEHTVALVWIGTGIGAGVVLDGRIYRGPGFRSGEIGHVDMGVSLRCRCGLVGCLETVAALPSIRGDATPEVIDRWQSGGDDHACRALGERIGRAGREFARLLSMMAGTLDVTEFVVGGPVVTDPLGPAVLRAINDALALRVMSGFSPLTARFSTLGAHSAVVGAVAHAIRQELGVVLTMVPAWDARSHC